MNLRVSVHAVTGQHVFLLSHHVHDVTAVPCRYYQLMTQLHLLKQYSEAQHSPLFLFSSQISDLMILQNPRPCVRHHTLLLLIFKTCRYTTPSFNDLDLFLEKLPVLLKLVKYKLISHYFLCYTQFRCLCRCQKVIPKHKQFTLIQNRTVPK